MQDVARLHERYREQATWTADLFKYLLKKMEIGNRGRLLEVGCGTGAILSNLIGYAQYRVFGIDLDRQALEIAQTATPQANIAQADALQLPFPSGAFDLTLCHFFLLWVADPGQALHEMQRVTRPGGYVLVLAEPDYGGRIDYPPPLDQLGELQILALQARGADPFIGRKLASLFLNAGIELVQTGVLGGQWVPGSLSDPSTEWETLKDDLSGQHSIRDWSKYEEAECTARQRGERVLFVPTFYALGRASQVQK